VAFSAPEFARSGHHHRFTEDRALGKIHILAHTFGIDLQPGDEVACSREYPGSAAYCFLDPVLEHEVRSGVGFVNGGAKVGHWAAQK